jgi:hypothetical protein
MLGAVENVIVLIVKETLKSKVNIVLVNNTLRDRRVLKLVLVFRAIKKCFSILGCHLTQPKTG